MRPALLIPSLALALCGCGLKHHDDVDLTFDHGLRSSPNPPTTIDKLTLSFDIVNDSNVDVDNVEWVINRDGALFRNGAFPHIDAGDYEFGSFPFTETAGPHVYEFVIDPNHRIGERSENNNVSVIQVVVPPGGTG